VESWESLVCSIPALGRKGTKVILVIAHPRGLERDYRRLFFRHADVVASTDEFHEVELSSLVVK
jgi:hypothetical protein